MLPGLFGGDVLTAANLAGYTYYRPDEVQEIVESLTPDGKAAYLLHTNKNMSLDKVRFAVETGALIYGTYKSSKSGKVITSSKQANGDSLLDAEFKEEKPVATVDQLIEMGNKRNNVKIQYAEGDTLEYYKSVGAEGSHWIDENGVSNIVIRKDVASRRTVFHEWLHKYLQKKNGGNYRPNEDMMIEKFLDRHSKLLKIKKGSE